MTPARIKKLVMAPKLWPREMLCRPVAIDVEKKEVLYYDADNRYYCINTFEIVGTEVEFSPMPIQSFDASR